MKRCAFVLASISMLIYGCGREKPSEYVEPYSDREEIKNNSKGYEEAYNNHDAQKVASFWSSNAVYVVPDTGETLQGRSAIADFFKNLFENKDQPHIDVIIDNIIFKGPDKAIEYGHVKFSDKDGNQDETYYRAVDVKENGKWVLQTVREVETRTAPSNYEHLQDLNWLIGSWHETNEDSDIDLNFKWSLNKNLLIEHFTVKILDRDEMEGIQIIAWDPDQKSIRSWIFDSDGNFREGTWSKRGNKWIASMAARLADGTKGSSIDIYTKLDDNNFTFDMDARDIGGNILPDVGPVNFKKNK